MVVSPISIFTALGLIGLGAAGKTADEIWTALHLELNERHNATYEFAFLLKQIHRNPLVKMANQLFVQDGLHIDDIFIQTALAIYGSGVKFVHFADSQQSAATINDWVSKKTNGQINDLVTSDMLNADTKMVLVNSIYFKGDWETPFDPIENTNVPFNTIDGRSDSIEMMRMDEFVRYEEVPELDAKIIELPYQDSNTSMIFILPNTANGLRNLETKLHTFDLIAMRRSLSDNMEAKKRPKVLVSLPKFKVEFNVDLENALKKVNFNYLQSKIC